jgi:hypothetical protein
MTLNIRCADPGALVGRYRCSLGLRWADASGYARPALVPVFATAAPEASAASTWNGTEDSTVELVRASPVALNRWTDLDLGVWKSDPGQVTTGFNATSALFVGFHVDEPLDGDPYPDRADLRRAGTNMGPGDRWIMWSDLPDGAQPANTGELHQICAALGDGILALPVHHLLVRPGETYLIRQWRLAHDGSTSNATSHSSIRSRLGLFPVGAMPTAI